jgi:hypothetical protein
MLNLYLLKLIWPSSRCYYYYIRKLRITFYSFKFYIRWFVHTALWISLVYDIISHLTYCCHSRCFIHVVCTVQCQCTGGGLLSYCTAWSRTASSSTRWRSSTPHPPYSCPSLHLSYSWRFSLNKITVSVACYNHLNSQCSYIDVVFTLYSCRFRSYACCGRYYEPGSVCRMSVHNLSTYNCILLSSSDRVYIIVPVFIWL